MFFFLVLHQALLASEQQVSDAAKKASAEDQNKKVELMKKLEDANTRIDQLQDSAQRYIC